MIPVLQLVERRTLAQGHCRCTQRSWRNFLWHTNEPVRV